MSPAQIEQALHGVARRAAESLAARDGSLCGAPIVEHVREGDRLRFVFDAMVLFSAQSGSDWYLQHLFSGTATVGADRLIGVETVSRRVEQLTEHEVEWAEPPYDRRSALRAMAREVFGEWP